MAKTFIKLAKPLDFLINHCVMGFSAVYIIEQKRAALK